MGDNHPNMIIPMITKPTLPASQKFNYRFWHHPINSHFSKHLSFAVGDGTRIRFWHDRWIGENSLKDRYPKLYACSAVKDACIFEVLWAPEGGTVRVWNLSFYRAFEDRELDASYSLFQLLKPRIPRGVRRDTLC